MKYKQLLANIFICMTAAIIGLWGYDKWSGRERQTVVYIDHTPALSYAGFHEYDHTVIKDQPLDLTKAAEMISPSVVRITTKFAAQKTQRTKDTDQADKILENFFGIDPRVAPEQRATGSGVIISANGYIVTNNHVVAGTNGQPADEISVTLTDNTSLTATLIGKDPASDLAVLKVKSENLTPVSTGNSDELKPGQWVLAIGYPSGLDITVTAGIISGKYRNIGINRRQSQEPVEAFIQTDAAISQGNSGGALVTADGELVGINSAMLASNGAYSGYGFSIPVNMVKKITADLIRFGTVQKAWMGLTPSAEKPSKIKGVIVESVVANGPAATAGLKAGDIITEVNGIETSSWNVLLAQSYSLNPGDKMRLVFRRDDAEKTISVELKKQVPL